MRQSAAVYTQFRNAQIDDVAEGAVLGKSTANLPDYDEYAFIEEDE